MNLNQVEIEPGANMTAFNYQTQNWITGDAATVLRISQLTEELELLESKMGDEYCRMINCDKSVAVNGCREQLASLGAFESCVSTNR